MSSEQPELTLDPASWEDLRAHGHRVLDELLDWLHDVRERPAWQPMPEAARAALRGPAPAKGEGLEAAWDDYRFFVHDAWDSIALTILWAGLHPPGALAVAYERASAAVDDLAVDEIVERRVKDGYR